ncbi:hypothetical protein [Pseudomonas farris]
MTSAQQPDNAINLLRELDIPGRTKVPVSTNPDVWGLNIAAVLDNFPRHGLQCLAGPWGTMGVGDRLVIFRGSGNQVLQDTVDENEVGKELTMFVESRHLGEGPHDISYTVTRLGQTPEPSEVMKVLVKLTRPGGHDDNDEAGHSKLIMTIPPGIIAGGIDQDNVANGVDITIERYPGIAAGDVIRLSWGGVSVFSPPLTQDQADGKTPIIIHVNEATIREAGDSDENGLAVVFEVYDLVDNRSEDWSAAQRVVVTIDQQRPLAPLLKEALNNVLDVDKLGNANGTAQIIAMDSKFFARGDSIFVRLRGTPVEGAPIDEELPGKLLESVPSIPEIAIPNALLRRLAKTQMVLSYRIQKADGSAGFLSKGQFISVIGEVQRLKPPIAEDARQGALDPDLPRTRIEIPFDSSFEAGQVIKLFWLGTLPDHTPYLPDLPLRPITQGDIDAKLPLYMTVDAAHIKRLEGGTLELYYQLLIADSVLATLDHYTALHAVRESEHAALLNVGEPRQELPAPTVDGVVDGALDPDRNGTTLTATWLNTQDKDEVIREWEGTKTGLSSDSITLNSFTAGKPVPFSISAALIKGNDGGTASARYSVVRAGEHTRYSHPLAFSVGAALELDPPKIRQAEPDGTTLQPIKAVDALTAVIPPEGLLGTDLLSVTWTGASGTAAGGSHTTAAKPILETGLSIALPVTVLAFSLGKTVTVTFTITRDGKTLSSRPLSLNVGTLPVTALNSPIIMDADASNVLDIVALGNKNVTIHALDWLLIAIDQHVWMRLKGKKANGDDHDLQIWNGGASFVNSTWFEQKYWARTVANSYFKELADGSSLTLSFKAALDKSNVEANALVFADQIYTIKAFEVVTPEITKATDSKNVEIPQAGTTADTAVTLTGAASKGQKVQIFDGTTSKGEASAHLTSGIWTHAMTGLSVAAHSFTAKALYGSGQVSTPARTLTVTAVVAPTITKAADSKNVEIPQAGITADTAVTLSGTASKGQKVQILDGETIKGEAIAHLTSGIWTLVMTGLSVAAHSFTAKALYGSGQVSTPARTLTVTAVVPPTITKAEDSKNVLIPQSGFTVDTTVKLTGVASKGQKVQIKDGTTVKGEATANTTNGEWSLTLTGLSVAAHSFTATALYGSGQVSTPARTLTITASATPTITKAEDSKNVLIPQAGFTVDTTVKLTGVASKGQKVQIKDGTTVKGEATANTTNGEWSLTLTGLSVAAHSFTAKALYGSGQVSTPARTLTVTAVVAPTITKAADSKNVEIPQAGITADTAVTLTGAASKGQKVQIFDGTTSKGEATAHLTSGIWTHAMTGLSVAAHSFTAKALYGSGQVSTPARTLTVIEGTIEDFESIPLGPFRTITNRPLMDFQAMSTTSLPDISTGASAYPDFSGRALYISKGGSVLVTFKRYVERVSLVTRGHLTTSSSGIYATYNNGPATQHLWSEGQSAILQIDGLSRGGVRTLNFLAPQEAGATVYVDNISLLTISTD